tara:strand:- start:251 stop:511 length:261 start_codon:yes stop_codon:yes gene_type:complete
MTTTPIPLSILLLHVLLAFEQAYGSTDTELSALPVLANILRVLVECSVDIKAVPELARISTRAVRTATQNLEREGWLSMTPVKRGL